MTGLYVVSLALLLLPSMATYCNKVELVQLSEKFDSAQLQWGNGGEWDKEGGRGHFS